MNKFFESIFIESIICGFKNPTEHLTEETAEAYYNYLRNKCNFERDHHTIQKIYKTYTDFDCAIDNSDNSKRNYEDNELCKEKGIDKWEDGSVNDFITKFTNILNNKGLNDYIKACYLRYLAEYLKLNGNREEYKTIKNQVQQLVH